MRLDSTCWTLVRGAVAGGSAERDDLARRYEPLVTAYLRKRWGSGRLAQEVHDATQDVFVELVRAGGALERFDEERTQSFRGFLYAVVRNVARRVEERHAIRDRERAAGSAVDRLECDEERLSKVYDRLWVRTLVREAIETYRSRALAGDEDDRRRVDVLELRLLHGRPIRDIAKEWQADAARLHKAYARAREEFKKVLFEVVSFQTGGSPGEIERELRLLTSELRA